MRVKKERDVSEHVWFSGLQSQMVAEEGDELS